MLAQESKRVSHQGWRSSMKENQVSGVGTQFDVVINGVGKLVIQRVWLTAAKLAATKGCVP
jgi:NAD dependent epimerase/dehydratase family enzyme